MDARAEHNRVDEQPRAAERGQLSRIQPEHRLAERCLVVRASFTGLPSVRELRQLAKYCGNRLAEPR